MTPDSDYSAKLEVQQAHGTGERRKLHVVFETFADKCLTLTTSEQVAISTVVGVEYNDVLFVGEVVRCTATGEPWAMDVKVAQTLTGLQSLLILRAQLDQHQTESKDVPIEVPVFCEVPRKGNKKALKTRQEHYVLG
ncbi:MAG: hypothetical protein ACR2JB_02275 [Bryobacteraceae bacterium]